MCVYWFRSCVCVTYRCRWPDASGPPQDLLPHLEGLLTPRGERCAGLLDEAQMLGALLGRAARQVCVCVWGGGEGQRAPRSLPDRTPERAPTTCTCGIRPVAGRHVGHAFGVNCLQELGSDWV